MCKSGGVGGGGGGGGGGGNPVFQAVVCQVNDEQHLETVYLFCFGYWCWGVWRC